MTIKLTPLVQVLRDLRDLVQQGASGFFFIVTEENQSCIVRLNEGLVQDVVFRMVRNDEAVQRLSMVGAARARFQAGRATPGGRTELGADALQWLLGGFESDPGLKAGSAPAAAASGSMDARQRKALEDLALNFLGPIGPMLCDEALEASSDPKRVVELLSSNLSSPDEVRRFLTAAAAALGIR